jgi:hypothetical protein
VRRPVAALPKKQAGIVREIYRWKLTASRSHVSPVQITPDGPKSKGQNKNIFAAHSGQAWL